MLIAELASVWGGKGQTLFGINVNCDFSKIRIFIIV